MTNIQSALPLALWLGISMTTCDKSPRPADTDAVSARQSITTEKTDKPSPPSVAAVDAPLAYFGKPPAAQPLIHPVAIAPLRGGSVVLLVFDALNAKHLGAYGYHRDTSPTIDSLANSGLTLLNHVSNSSWTRPSFTTIITGVPKSVHGVELENGWRLDPSIKTLGERFRNAGYRTALFTGNPLVRKAWGFDQGFQHFEDPITLGLKAFPRDGILVDHAIRWLKSVSNKQPVFLVMFLTSPHAPYRPPMKPRRFLAEVPAGEIIAHPFKEYQEPLAKADSDRIEAAYDDEIAYMDGQVARLVARLRSSGRLTHTVIAMTADHGEAFGTHNCYLHAYHMWDPVLRVPFILNAPNLPVAGVYDHWPSTHMDIAPTLLDFVGIDFDDDELPGLSMAKIMASRTANENRVIFSQHNAHGVRREAIRSGRWKLIHHHRVKAGAAEKLDELHPGVPQPDPKQLPTLAWDRERYELYDLKKDTAERINLFAAQRQSPEVATLMSALQPHIADGSSQGQLTEEMIQALENAGYLSPERRQGAPN